VSRKILIHSLRSPTHAICHPPSLLLTGCTFSYSFCSRCCSCSSIIRSRFIRCRSASRITPSCIFYNQQSWRMWGVRLSQTLDSDGQSRLLSSWRWLRERELLWTLGTWAGVGRHFCSMTVGPTIGGDRRTLTLWPFRFYYGNWNPQGSLRIHIDLKFATYRL